MKNVWGDEGMSVEKFAAGELSELFTAP